MRPNDPRWKTAATKTYWMDGDGIHAADLVKAVSLALTELGFPCTEGDLSMDNVNGTITIPFKFRGLSPDRKTSYVTKGVAQVEFGQVGDRALPEVTFDIDGRSVKVVRR